MIHKMSRRIICTTHIQISVVIGFTLNTLTWTFSSGFFFLFARSRYSSTRHLPSGIFHLYILKAVFLCARCICSQNINYMIRFIWLTIDNLLFETRIANDLRLHLRREWELSNDRTHKQSITQRCVFFDINFCCLVASESISLTHFIVFHTR